jgi:8-oxo-dGTP pyrophosphatase MutT (NUDIX family)
MAENEKPVAVPVPAATILLLRDAPGGLEVFMVKRHHQIDFVAGALVFPGGKVEKSDADAALTEFFDGGADWTETMRAMGAGAIREAFEESGILLARDARHGDFVTSERLADLQLYRPLLEKREAVLADVLRKEKLRLALDQLVHFAHWITPANMPKRFDTHFFLASSPIGHAGSHDGRESVDSIWITPNGAISDRKKWNVIFPTKLNLMKLANSSTVGEAISTARSTKVLPVTPWVENGPDGQMLRIREDAGYAQTSASMRDGL